jgi:hypothetical protein
MNDARRLVERLNGLPLALATAGAFPKVLAMRGLHEYGNRTLYITWDLPLTQIRSGYPDATTLLGFLACFDIQDVWYELVHAGTRPERATVVHILIGDKLLYDRRM